MPLIQGKSPKAFKKNVEAEMDAGKPQKQSLAIAYSVKRKNAKKMASGGVVEYGKGPEDDMEPGVPGRKHDDNRPTGYMAGDFKDGSDIDDAEDTSMGPKKDEYDAVRSGGAYVDGGVVERGAGPEADMEPGVPKRKSDDYRRPESSYMGKDWAGEPELDDASDTSMGPSHDEYDAVQWAADGGEMKSIADAIMFKKHKAKMMADGGMVDLEANSEESPNMEDQYSFDADKKEQYDLDQLGPDPMDSNEDSRHIDSDAHDMISTIRRKMLAKRGR